MTAARSGEVSSELRTRLVWLTLFRVIAGTLLLAAVALRLLSDLPRELTSTDTLVFASIAGIYVCTLAYALRLRAGHPTRLDAIFQVVGDLVIATGLVFITGGGESPFTFMFSLAVLGAALLLGTRGALATAAVSTFAYAAVLFVVQAQVLVPPLGATQLSGSRLVFLLFSNVLALTFIAVLAGYLSRQLAATGGRLVQR